MAKIVHYNLAKILEEKAKYNVIYGERTNGKSYAVKLRCLERAWKFDEKFIYLRRWREDLQLGRAVNYFNDMVEDDLGNKRVNEITEGEYDFVDVYRSEIFFAKYNENNKKIRSKSLGFCKCLTGETHDKSVSYVKYYRIIYEEMVTKSGYLVNEVSIFMSFVSTVFRLRNGEVFMIGNTITQECPFFREWQLINIPKQKQGTIDIYYYKTGEFNDNDEEEKVKIAVEYCPQTGNKHGMIFGNKMITKGAWETKNYPHLEKNYSEYKKRCSILFLDGVTLYALDILIDDIFPFIFVRKIDKKWTKLEKYDIIITEEFHLEPQYFRTLRNTTLGSLIRKLYNNGKICYEDNLTAENFNTFLLSKNVF